MELNLLNLLKCKSFKLEGRLVPAEIPDLTRLVISTRYAIITFPVLPPPTPVTQQTFLPVQFQGTEDTHLLQWI